MLLPDKDSPDQKENDIQRYLQLREDMNTAIEKIDPSVAKLNETTKRFISHFDVFQKMTQDAREQMKQSIKEAAHDISNTAAEQLSQKIDILLKDKVKTLDEAIENAIAVLKETMSLKYRKLLLLSCLGVMLGGLAGFGGGHIYAKHNTYEFPREIINLSALAYQYKRALEKMTPQQKEKLKKQFPELPLSK